MDIWQTPSPCHVHIVCECPLLLSKNTIGEQLQPKFEFDQVHCSVYYLSEIGLVSQIALYVQFLQSLHF